MVLVLGWLLSNKFWNNGLLCAPVCCVVVVGPVKGGGVAVEW